MKKYNVLHIITKLELGGAQQNTLYTLKKLDKNLFNCFLISGSSGFLVKEAKEIENVKSYFLPFLKREISPIYDLLTTFEIYRIIKKHSIDIVHTHSSKAGILGRIAAKLAKVKIIIHTIHGFGFSNYQSKIMKNIYIGLEKLVAFFTDILIAVSYENVKTGLNVNIGTKEKYRVIHSGIKLKDFFEANVNIKEIKEKLCLKENHYVVGMIAPFKPQKSPLDFVLLGKMVIKILPNTQFVLVGDGELKNKIVDAIKKFGLQNNFILLGFRRDIKEIISTFDLLVLTSLWEGLPRVIIEAFAMKKPVVATDVDGIREVVKDGITGFLVKPKDIPAMAEKTIYLLKNKDLIKKIGEQGQKLIIKQKFDIDEMVKEIENLYLELLKTGSLCA